MLENYNWRLMSSHKRNIIQLSELLENYNCGKLVLIDEAIIQLSELLENYNPLFYLP